MEQERAKYPLFYGEILLNDKQQDFLYAEEHREHGLIIPPRTRGFSAGNRGGKSSSGYLEDFAWGLGYRPWLSPDHPNYYTPFKPPIKILLCTESLSTTAKDALWSDIQGLIPPQYIDWHHIEKINSTGAVIGIPLFNGSFIRIMAYNQKTKDFESTHYQAIHYDEPPPEDKYIASQRGLVDNHGFTWLTFTNLREPWLKRDIVDRHDGKTIHIVKGSIWDNEIRYINGKQKGGLTHEAINAYLDKIKDPKIRKVRETGEAEHFAGPVYAFDDAHIIKDPLTHPIFRNHGGKPPKHWTRGMVVDPHENRPYAMAWYAVSPEGHIYFYDEYPADMFHELSSDNKNIEQLAELIKSKEKGDKIFIRYLDKVYYKKPSMSTKLTLADEFAQHDIFFYPTEEISPHTTIQMVSDALYYDKTKAIDSINRPKAYIFGTCPNLIYGMINYYWKDLGDSQDNEGFSDRPSKKGKCFPDLFGYAVVSEPKSYAPKPEQGQRKVFDNARSSTLKSMVRARKAFRSRSEMYAHR
ncbi:MAG: hypothetical protein UY18_C0018G0006 [Microgenomates group bacterium GW2011_GWF2_47_9]|nr:MAG: hypothetical protein UY18_C0018G0006 [Microgenomates group bacterium GW2011_GWF2_47_9]